MNTYLVKLKTASDDEVMNSPSHTHYQSPHLLRVPAEEDELDETAVGAGQLAAVRAGEGQDVLVERGEGVGVDGEDADVREAERGGHLVQCDGPGLLHEVWCISNTLISNNFLHTVTQV